MWLGLSWRKTIFFLHGSIKVYHRRLLNKCCYRTHYIMDSQTKCCSQYSQSSSTQTNWRLEPLHEHDSHTVSAYHRRTKVTCSQRVRCHKKLHHLIIQAFNFRDQAAHVTLIIVDHAWCGCGVLAKAKIMLLTLIALQLAMWLGLQMYIIVDWASAATVLSPHSTTDS